MFSENLIFPDFSDFKDLHLTMGQKHLIWDRVWDVKSTKSNLYL